MTGELPEGRHLRVENKNFYFDIGQNNRGIYMRISEVSGFNFCFSKKFHKIRYDWKSKQVKTNYRTAVTIPEKSWSRFRDIFSDYVDKMKDGGSAAGGAGGATAVTPTSSSVAADNSPGPSSGSHKSL
jgi:uncharacterized protein YmfQ (DUF2313 family)